MQVQFSFLSENIYRYYQQTQGATGTKSMNRDLSNAFDREIRCRAEPKDQILADYRAWKEQQPARTLPKSVGATEENLACLRTYFSGKLDLFQRIDAVDTMREMGILTEEQMLNYLGLGESTIGVITEDTPNVMFIPAGLAPEMISWMKFFGTSPIGFCDDLEKLLKVLDVRMRFEGQENVAEQIQAILTRTTHRRAV